MSRRPDGGRPSALCAIRPFRSNRSRAMTWGRATTCVVGMFSEEGRLTADGRQALEEFAQILQRDFHAPMLVIGSYPEPGRYRAQCEAVQRFLRLGMARRSAGYHSPRKTSPLAGDSISTIPVSMISRHRHPGALREAVSSGGLVSFVVDVFVERLQFDRKGQQEAGADLLCALALDGAPWRSTTDFTSDSPRP